jgi:hypothetical protein
MYLPIDPETNANRGYAFLNFVSASHAWMFKMSYDGRKMIQFNSNKVAAVVKATLQGFEANYAHYSTTRVHKGDPAARPLFLREPANLGLLKSRSDNKKRGTQRKNISVNANNADKVVSVAAPQILSPYPNKNTHDDLNLPTKNAVPDDGNKQQSIPQGGPRFCPHCGGPVRAHFQFCPHCGQSVMVQ